MPVDWTITCNRIDMRMECLEHGYPYSEALYPTDYSIPHIIQNKGANKTLYIIPRKKIANK